MKNDANDFYSKMTCDRCGSSLRDGRTMSMFNTDCICMKCKYEEMKSDKYNEVIQSNLKNKVEVIDYDFEGVGY